MARLLSDALTKRFRGLVQGSKRAKIHRLDLDMDSFSDCLKHGPDLVEAFALRGRMQANNGGEGKLEEKQPAKTSEQLDSHRDSGSVEMFPGMEEKVEQRTLRKKRNSERYPGTKIVVEDLLIALETDPFAVRDGRTLSEAYAALAKDIRKDGGEKDKEHRLANFGDSSMT